MTSTPSTPQSQPDPSLEDSMAIESLKFQRERLAFDTETQKLNIEAQQEQLELQKEQVKLQELQLAAQKEQVELQLAAQKEQLEFQEKEFVQKENDMKQQRYAIALTLLQNEYDASRQQFVSNLESETPDPNVTLPGKITHEQIVENISKIENFINS